MYVIYNFTYNDIDVYDTDICNIKINNISHTHDKKCLVIEKIDDVANILKNHNSIEGFMVICWDSIIEKKIKKYVTENNKDILVIFNNTVENCIDIFYKVIRLNSFILFDKICVV